ncbi:MAG: hypothetical protein B6I24_00225 [Bacteroidetes bacterium 4572_128]|nr:MAG: hypothetical protein B6I24_00225 [Bacteroidetes bacterium 4572_128]
MKKSNYNILKIFDYILTIFPHFYLKNDKKPFIYTCSDHLCHYLFMQISYHFILKIAIIYKDIFFRII